MFSKFVWVKGPLSQPHDPHGFQNLALGVEPRVPDTSGPKPTGLVKGFDGVGTGGGFAGGAPRMVGEIF